MPSGNTKKFKYLDLFAGVGGFAAALNSQGGFGVLGAEIDHKAARVYELNFGHSPLNDVRELAKSAATIEDFHVVAGGFPCQPFSKSGSQLGTSESRGNLFDEIAEIIKAKKPTVVLLENVKNLVGPKHLDEWNRIVAVLRNLGYKVSETPSEFSPHLLPRALSGRPQHRVRIFITATYNPNESGTNTEKPLPVITLSDGEQIDWDLFSDLPVESKVDSSYDLRKEELDWLSAWQEWVSHLKQTQGVKLPGFPMWSDFWATDLPAEFETYPDWKKKFVTQNRDLYLANKKFVDTWLGNWKVRENFPATKRKFEWQAGNESSVWECLIQFRPSGIRVKKANYIPTLVALNQTPILGNLKRRLTATEAARAQGFPDGFDFGDQPDSATYKQMGNAVNVGVIAHVLRKHCERDRDILERTTAGREILTALAQSPSSPDNVFKAWGARVAPWLPATRKNIAGPQTSQTR